ncbi:TRANSCRIPTION FACTOR BHLH30 [Salix purpurea]|nr:TRANSCRIPTION FACTOR BHLH30 [Salix purpurea]
MLSDHLLKVSIYLYFVPLTFSFLFLRINSQSNDHNLKTQTFVFSALIEVTLIGTQTEITPIPFPSFFVAAAAAAVVILAMEACSWNSTRVQVSGFEGMSGGSLVNSGLQAKTRAGPSSTSALVLDNERGELVEATVRMERKVVSAKRSIAALKNHSEAEKKRRARINAHLDTLRSLVPGTSKMDKASLLAEVITHLKELKIQATEASEGLLMPLDIDELRVEQEEGGLHGGPYVITASICCDCKPGVLSDLRQELDALHLIIMRAEIATLEGRMRNVFVMSSCNEGDGGGEFRGGSIHQALRSILDRFSASQEFSLKSTVSNKRRRVGLFKPSLSSSSGDL